MFKSPDNPTDVPIRHVNGVSDLSLGKCLGWVNQQPPYDSCALWCKGVLRSPDRAETVRSTINNDADARGDDVSVAT